MPERGRSLRRGARRTRQCQPPAARSGFPGPPPPAGREDLMLRQTLTYIQVLFGALPVNSAGVKPRPRAMPRRLRVYIIAVCAAFVSATAAAFIDATPDLTPRTVGTA